MTHAGWHPASPSRAADAGGLLEYATHGARLLHVSHTAEIAHAIALAGVIARPTNCTQQSLDARRARYVDAKEAAMYAAYRVTILASAITLGMTSHASWAEQTVNATLLSSSIHLGTHNVKAGRITLAVKNAADNNMEHELVVLKTDLSDDALPVSQGQVLEHKLRKIGEVEDIAPGRTKRVSFKLAPGHYALICNKPGHYAAGMHTALVVTP